MLPITLILFSFLLLIGIAASLGITVLVIGRRLDTTWAKPLACLGVIAAFFMGTYLLELNSTGLEAKLFWGYAQYLSKVSLPLGYFMFTLAYTENSWYRPRVLITASIIPVLSLIFLWFDVNDLMYRSVSLVPSSIGPNVNAEYGWWFWLFVVHSYLMLTAGAGVLIHALFSEKQGLTRLQILILTVCSIIPAIGNLFTVFDIVEVDLTPIFIGAMAVIMGYALMRLRLFDIEPTRMAVLEKMSDAYLTVDLNNRVIDFNRTAKKILNRSTWQMRNSTLVSFNIFSEEVKAQLLQPDFTGRLEDTFATKRDYRRFAIYVSNLFKPGQSPYARLIFMRDITKQRQLEQSQQDLIRAVIHDLRSPISTTVGLLDMLQEDLEEETIDRPEALKILTRSNLILQNNIQLIEQSLELSRLENGQIRLNFEPVPLEEIWFHVQQVMQPASERKKVSLQANWQPGIPSVYVDRLFILRVMQNLIENGIKFSPANGQVQLSAEAIDENGHPQIAVSVQNTGSTVPREVQHLLFQKFSHGTQPEHGYGLGLAFCRTVLEAHGENIWLAESDSNGTTFTFTLPVAGENISKN